MRAGLLAVVCGLLGLAGCSVDSLNGLTSAGATGANGGLAGARLSGAVHGGQQPIVDAHVYLFAANTTGYGGAGIAASSGNASASLLTSGVGTTLDSSGGPTNGDYYVTTDTSGNFSITGDYTCAPGQQAYLYALGGNPGSGMNTAAGLMVALGACPTAGNFLAATPYVVVNEVSTVASAYAFAGFATDATHVGSSGTALALTGIANAFANAANLETLSTGVALATTPTGNGAVPQDEINTLANILASCVNTNSATSTSCTTLFANVLAAGTTGTAPGDTATAAINIAHNPGTNVANLYALTSGTAPFAPALAFQPNDFTVALTFAGGGLNVPSSLAVDGSGNVWVANYGSPGGNSVSEFSSTGAALSPSVGYTGGGLNGPASIAIDNLGNVWVANYNSSISELTASGVAVSPSTGDTGGGLYQPFTPASLAIDSTGNSWIANVNGNSISEFSNVGVPLSPASGGYVGGGVSQPISIAVDGSGLVWIGNDGATNSSVAPNVSRFSNAGVALSPSTGYVGGGLTGPEGLAIDSAGDVWVSNRYVSTSRGVASSISEFSKAGTPLSPSTGYRSKQMTDCTSIAIDPSGNVWVQNYDSSANTVSEVIGVAAPVITPISAGLPATPTADGSSKLGTRP